MKSLLFIFIILAVAGGTVYLLVVRPQSTSLPSQENTNTAPPKTDAGTSDKNEETAEAPPITDAGTSTKNEGTAEPPSVQEKVSPVEVRGFEFGFDPYIIGLAMGEKVKLTFKNTGKMSHDWVLEGTSIRTKVTGPGATDVIEFTAPAKGTYKFYCSISGHRQAGMEGTLTVN